ncbi:SARP family transcriptional regulator [Phytohabitans rumicis]|uniref:SARP family transcriptional regulator n=1 Tax=Phytohabitans rumicis TaxID=1076125 RepID=A0A6V8LBG1_9ACTN|nr:SARP family transcriptional regulator [Phytohabitans rumicis]
MAGPALADAVSGAVRDRLCGGLEELRFAAISDRIDAELDAGRHANQVAELARLTEELPLRERLHGQLMIALYRCGRRADALETYRRARRVLVAELGLEPGRQLREIHASIIADTAGPAGDTDRDMPAATAPEQLPLDLAGFVGRAAYLHQLDAQLTARSPATATTTCVITGTAGVGKTALAVHWAHRVADQFPDGQLYLNLHGFDHKSPPAPAGEAVRGLLEALGVPAARIPTTVETQAGLYRSLLSGRRVLIVLDNARDAEQVRPLLPGTPGCLVVVTSRNQLTGLVALDGAHPMTLGLLAWDEAQELLACRLGADRTTAEPDAVHQIITRTAQLPLALAIVAARAATNGGQPLAALARELGETGLDSFDGGDRMADLRAVFSWSYQALGAAEARLFRLLGLHPGPDVAIAAAASLAGTPVPQVRAMLATLARAHLIVEHTTGRYTFHDLLRAYAAELAHRHDPGSERRAALHRTLEHYLHTAYGAHQLLSPHHGPIPLAAAGSQTFPEHLVDARQAMAWYAANHRVLLNAVRLAADAGMDAIAWQLPWTLLEFFDRQGHWHDQVDIFRVALDAACRLADPAGQAHAHRGLGRAYGRLRRHADAYDHLLRAMDLYRDLGDQASQARTHANLAGILEKQGRSAEAIDHDQQALSLYRALGDLSGQARTLNNIGWYHALQGDHLAAIAHCQQALELLLQTGDRRGQANTWHSLGYAHHHLRHYRDAASSYQHALDRYREVGDRYHEADTLTHLGDTQYAANNLDAAHHTWSQARDILDALGHPDAAKVNAKLSLAHPTFAPSSPGLDLTALPLGGSGGPGARRRL